MKIILIPLMFIGVLISGCTFTKFDSDKEKIVYKRVLTHSGVYVDAEHDMGEITIGKVDTKSDIAVIENKNENVIWVNMGMNREQINSPIIRAASQNESDEGNENLEGCGLRAGAICKTFEYFDLVENLEDVPSKSIGRILTCQTGNTEMIYSCQENQARCMIGKLGSYCIKE